MSMGMEDNELAEILEEFFTEAEENLDKLEQDMIQLEAMSESGTTDPDTVNRLFRVLHTIKGGAGFLGLEKMAKLAHAGENLLDEVRNDKVPVTKPVMDALLLTNDDIKVLLAIHKSRGDDSHIDNSALIEVLTLLATGAEAPAVSASPTPPPAPTASAPVAANTGPSTLNADGINPDLLAEIMEDPILDPSRDKGDDDGPKAPSAAPTPAANTGPSTLNADGINPDLLAEIMTDPILDPSRDKGDDDGPKAAAPTPTAVPAAAAPAPTLIPREAPKAAAAPERRAPTEDRRQPNAGGRRTEESTETIRVETHRLDKVMNLVGELVLARNTMVRQLQMPHIKAILERTDNAASIYGVLEQFSRVTQDIQMSVLSTRMQPIKKVFDKIPRQVRELKTQLAKEVNLIIEGEMTEVDKTLVEELGDPMMHMIRNALDHGLEGPDERANAGKHPEGTLSVKAFYEGNNVVIQVQEDGRGIDPNRIRNVAIKKGIITAEAAAALTDNEAIRLIMAPGFSTAEKITDVSGRGVGMDVVNTKIMNLKGSLDIRSELGMGTCFSIYMPLTLAIVNALIVGANQEGFAIPIGDIAEVIQFTNHGIHKINEQDVIELRGEPLPLYYLNKITKYKTAIASYNSADIKPIQASDNLSLDDLEHAVSMATGTVAAPASVIGARPTKGFVVVVRSGSSSMGLVVEELLGQEEVVVKAVTNMFEYNKAVSGATITGDGKVHMILDIPYLLKNLSGNTHA